MNKEHDEYMIRFNSELGMYVAYVNDNPLMKNKKKSVLAIKLGKWLQSQGQ